jgi:hypothetical protein
LVFLLNHGNDGKFLQMSNHLEGYKCWVCPEDTASTDAMCESGAVRHYQNFFFAKKKKSASGVRYGAFLPCIPITRRVGDFSHCAARVVNALLKRLEATLQSENVLKGI